MVLYPVCCCIWSDNDCDHAYNRYHYTYAHMFVVLAILPGVLVVVVFVHVYTVLHRHKGHSENLFVSTGSSRRHQILVIVSKF